MGTIISLSFLSLSLLLIGWWIALRDEKINETGTSSDRFALMDIHTSPPPVHTTIQMTHTAKLLHRPRRRLRVSLFWIPDLLSQSLNRLMCHPFQILAVFRCYLKTHSHTCNRAVATSAALMNLSADFRKRDVGESVWCYGGQMF